MYELVIVWYTDERDIYTYDSENEAHRAMSNMKLAFGDQLWCCVRPKLQYGGMHNE